MYCDDEYNQYYETDEDDDDNDDENEIMCTNMDPQLAKILGLHVEIELSDDKWTPPTTHGLNNSDRIINDLNNKNNLFEEIKKRIVTKQNLNDEQLNYIKTIDKDKLCEIINTYNNMVRNDYK